MASTPGPSAPALDGSAATLSDTHDVPALASPLPEPQQSAAKPQADTRPPTNPDLLPLASSASRTKANLLGSDGFGKLGAQLWAQREESVVRNRQGSVLNRGLILKTDHFAGGGRHAHLNLHLQGAPNFRKADCSLEVYGVAQPTITGLKTILSVLNARPTNDALRSKSFPLLRPNTKLHPPTQTVTRPRHLPKRLAGVSGYALGKSLLFT